MGLKAVLTAEEFAQTPEALRTYYTTSDPAKGYVLDADIEAHPAVAGLKNTVAATRKERDDAKAALQAEADKYKDIDPAKAREALAELQKLNDKKLIDEGKVEELLTARTERLRADHKNQLKAWETKDAEKEQKIGRLESKLSEITIDGGLREAAVAAGAKATAITDIILRGRRIWRLHEGAPTPFRDGGTDVLYGKDPSKPMSMEEWVAALATDAPHLFEGNKGAGTDPFTRQAAGGGKRIVLSRTEARDVGRWRAAQAEAAKTGAEVVIQD